MSDNDAERHKQVVHSDSGIAVLDAIDETKREQEEAGFRDVKYKQAQLKLSMHVWWFSAVLAVCAVIGGYLTILLEGHGR